MQKHKSSQGCSENKKNLIKGFRLSKLLYKTMFSNIYYFSSKIKKYLSSSSPTHMHTQIYDMKQVSLDNFFFVA